MANNEEYKKLLLPKLEELKRNAKLVTLVDNVELPEESILKPSKIVLDKELKQNLPKPYFNLIDYIYPKTNSLF